MGVFTNSLMKEGLDKDFLSIFIKNLAEPYRFHQLEEGPLACESLNQQINLWKVVAPTSCKDLCPPYVVVGNKREYKAVSLKKFRRVIPLQELQEVATIPH